MSRRNKKNFSRLQLRVEGRAVPCRNWDGAHLKTNAPSQPLPPPHFNPFLPSHERNN
jgi:hypothetical protein